MCKGKKHSCESICKTKEHCCQTTCRAELKFGKATDSLKKYVQYCLKEITTGSKKALMCADEAIHIFQKHAEIKSDIVPYLKELQKKFASKVKLIIEAPDLTPVRTLNENQSVPVMATAA